MILGKKLRIKIAILVLLVVGMFVVGKMKENARRRAEPEPAALPVATAAATPVASPTPMPAATP